MSINSDVREEEQSERDCVFPKGRKVYLNTKGKTSCTPNKNHPISRMLNLKNINFPKHSTGKKFTSKVSDVKLTYIRKQSDSLLLFL